MIGNSVMEIAGHNANIYLNPKKRNVFWVQIPCMLTATLPNFVGSMAGLGRCGRPHIERGADQRKRDGRCGLEGLVAFSKKSSGQRGLPTECSPIQAASWVSLEFVVLSGARWRPVEQEDAPARKGGG